MDRREIEWEQIDRRGIDREEIEEDNGRRKKAI
jgi:hypothetical protein